MHDDAHVGSQRRTVFGSWMTTLAILSVAPLTGAEVLQYGDGEADGKKSLGGSGHLILFDADKDGRWVNKLEVFGSRYGYPTPPDEDFHLYVVDKERRVLHDVSLPYSLWKRGEDYWRELPLPPIRVPKEFGIGLNFSPGRTKGVYVGTHEVLDSHSYSWLPGKEPSATVGADWMVRVAIDDKPDGDPEAADLVLLRDGEAFFDRLNAVGGRPLTVETAQHGKLSADEVVSVRLGAIVAPTEASATVVLVGGVKIQGEILSVDAKTIRLRSRGGAEREIARVDVARIDFRTKE